jgi:uncharacterized membrane protein
MGLARTWGAIGGATLAALLVGLLAAPRAVYDGFLWRYLWGPVYADAHNASCVVLESGTPQLEYTGAACQTAAGIVSEPGYTVVSEVVYMLVLLYALVGVLLLLRRLSIPVDRRLFYALVPFMLFGGALRTVEDAFDAGLAAGAEPVLTYPLNTWLISPLIYVTVFALTLGGLVGCRLLERRGVIEGYERGLAVVGTAALLAALGALTWLGVTTEYVRLLPQFTLLTVGFATLFALSIWYWLERSRPLVNAGTGFAGAVVIWAHAIDGVANVIGLDWAAELGYGSDLVGKHPVNRVIVDITSGILPPGLLGTIGDAWPFLVVKLVVATVIVSVFDEQIFEESPRYAYLLLIAITAVGLGPGTRDMLRMTFGI